MSSFTPLLEAQKWERLHTPSTFRGLDHAPGKEPVMGSWRGYFRKGQASEPGLHTHFGKDWELGFRDLPSTQTVCSGRSPRMPCLAATGEKTMTDDFKIFSDDSKFVRQNSTHWSWCRKTGTDAGVWDPIHDFQRYNLSRSCSVPTWGQSKPDVRHQEGEHFFSIAGQICKMSGVDEFE